MNRHPRSSSHDQAVDEKRASLLSHLMAVRSLTVRCLIAVLVAFVTVFYLACEPLMKFLTSPIEARGIEIIYTAVSEALTTQLKVSLIAGIVAASPFIFYQIWVFIKPGLYEKEIRLFRLLFLIGVLLFLLGVFFCYLYVQPLALNFFLVAGENLATPMLSLDKYIAFLLSFVLPFGVVFELPIAIFMATKKGLVSYEALAKNRKFVFFGLFILAAVLTPPDIISQVMLGCPMYLLYEVSVQIARLNGRKAKQENETEENEEEKE